MVDLESLSSGQARAYADAARSCARHLTAAFSSMPCVDPGAVAQGTEFKSPQATRLWSRLDAIGGDLGNAKSRLFELIAELQRIAARYDEMAAELQHREEASRQRAEEARTRASAATDRMRGRGSDPLPMPIMASGPLFEMGGRR